MRTQKTRFTALATVAVASVLVLGACGGQKASEAKASSSSVKTSQSSTSKSSSSTKASSKAQSEKETQASSSENQKAAISASASETTKDSVVKPSETPKTSAPAAESKEQTSPSSSSATTTPGGGGSKVTSGTLDIDKDVPVYVASDKSSAVAFTQPAGTSVDWDDYLIGVSNDNWYSFVKDGTRYYIAYSDIGH